MKGYDDLPHDAQLEIQRLTDKWFSERDAYAMRVAEAVREACAFEARNGDDHAIRSLDLHAILKGVER